MLILSLILTALFFSTPSFSQEFGPDVKIYGATLKNIVTEIGGVKIWPRELTKSDKEFYYNELNSNTIVAQDFNLLNKPRELFKVKDGIEESIYAISSNSKGNIIAASHNDLFLYIDKNLRSYKNSVNIYCPLITEDNIIINLNTNDTFGNKNSAFSVFSTKLRLLSSHGRSPFLYQKNGVNRLNGSPLNIIHKKNAYITTRPFHSVLKVNLDNYSSHLINQKNELLMAAQKNNTKANLKSGIKKYKYFNKGLFIYRDQVCSLIDNRPFYFIVCYKSDLSIDRVIRIERLGKEGVIAALSIPSSDDELLLLNVFTNKNHWHFRIYKENSYED